MKYLVISDIHLGHRVNESFNIDNNLNLFFNKYRAILTDIKVLFIAGDSFDRLLSTCSKEYIDSINCIIRIYKWCDSNGVKLRILEGTPSHDWRQCRVLNEVVKELGSNVDFRYVDDLEIENIDGYNVLYIPDEYRDKSIETMKEIRKKLEERNLKEVDICIMHGAFNYQLPIVLESNFIESEMEEIVKYFIHVGHIHTHTHRGKIVAQGSFDRLRFGEEEDKGAVVAEIGKTSNWIFLPNTNAMEFKTIDLSKVEEDKLFKILEKEIKKVKVGGCVRVIVDEVNKSLRNNPVINDMYKQWIIKFEVGKDKKKLTLADTIVEDNIIEAFSITKENIYQLVESEIEKMDITIQDKERILGKFTAILEKHD